MYSDSAKKNPKHPDLILVPSIWIIWITSLLLLSVIGSSTLSPSPSPFVDNFLDSSQNQNQNKNLLDFESPENQLCNDNHNQFKKEFLSSRHRARKPRKRPTCATSVENLLEGLDIAESPNFDGLNEQDLLPPWVNLTLAVRGQQFAMEHFHSAMASHGYGLAMLLAFPQISDVLLYTGNSYPSSKSAHRYAATIVQVILWMRRALTDSRDFNWVLKSLANVRRIHQHVALKMKSSFNHTLSLERRFGLVPINEEMWEAFSKDLQLSDIPLSMRQLDGKILRTSGDALVDNPMNQFAFAMTQWAFMGTVVMKPEAVFLYGASDDDLMAYSHLWAVIGYAMGLEDEFNIALKPNLNSLRTYLRDIFQTYYIPIFFNLSRGSKIAIESMILALVEMVPILDPEVVLRGILRDIVGIPTPWMNARRTFQGLKLDLVVMGLSLPSQIFPPQVFDTAVSVWASPLIHFPLGVRYFGDLYKSDEFIAKYCFSYWGNGTRSQVQSQNQYQSRSTQR